MEVVSSAQTSGVRKYSVMTSADRVAEQKCWTQSFLRRTLLAVNETAADFDPAIGTLPDAGQSTLKPFEQEFVTLTKREHIELLYQARQYQSLHARAVARIAYAERRHQLDRARFAQREAELKAALDAAMGQIRDLRLRVFGAKTEQSRSINAACDVSAGPPRPRGQQRGRRGHGRTRLGGLPARVEDVTLCRRRAHAAAWGWARFPAPRMRRFWRSRSRRIVASSVGTATGRCAAAAHFPAS